MADLTTERVQDIAALTEGLRCRGYYAKQIGNEVLVKVDQNAAQGFVFLFGLRHTYVNTYTDLIKEIPLKPTEILSHISVRSEADGYRAVLRHIPAVEVLPENDDALSDDLDLMKMHFAPELTFAEVQAGLKRFNIPHAVCDDRLRIFRRCDSSSLIGEFFLRNNLWHLSLPLHGIMRVTDLWVIELAYELESICQKNADVAWTVLSESYGVRKLGVAE